MSASRVAGLVFAGGRGSRLGASVPKPLVEIGGRPMIAHVLDRFPASVSPIVIGANDEAAFAAMPYPVVRDRIDGFRGPLSALDAARAWLTGHGDGVTHLLTLPADTPFLPGDVCGRLTREPGDRPRAAEHAGRLHPTAALWPLAALDRLESHLSAGGTLAVRAFADRCGGFETVGFADAADAPGGDPFFNVNTPDDLVRAEAAMAGLRI